MKVPAIIGVCAVTILSGCAMRPVAQPQDTPRLYTPAFDGTAAEPCQAMAEEVRSIDERLGEPAIEAPLPEPATAWMRIKDYGRNLAVETVLGFVQPVVQTVAALADTEGRSARAALGRERAMLRRAYLLGTMEGRGCSLPDLSGTRVAASAEIPVSDETTEPFLQRPRRGPIR